MTSATVGAPGSPRRYLHSLWLLTARDLKVRYATSALGYLWSVLDPLVMSAIYWFVFTQIFDRAVGAQPYIVFLITALLPWVWFNASVSDFTRAFNKDARLVRSTAIPRSIWVNRIVLSKGVEFLCSLPVLVVFAVFAGASVGWGLLWFPVAVVLQTMLLVGIGLLVAPLCVLWGDLERTTRLVLRALFYASPVIYGVADLPDGFRELAAFNPLAGIFTLYRVGFFPDQWDTLTVVMAFVMSTFFLVLGLTVFRRLEHAVLKEL
ncbi:ABC transporter permease [Microbacterium sp. zg.Y625]|uniref:ABC transporter permease n=1 Tax=Microbacterium jiangjiandongii TaxID=3049071 RepID=UPI00214C53F1|nr:MULTISPECIES: ABC transporter permease [unclassified Microbacterium]MCR2793760.1 ABC transporter permease [Microbacterium sp. zg.Y625]MCR2816160.1 ABC transporter permease [Microbacterium sp. zg.Y843]WIM26104.1 ABC transporter permease [Microbacterium sp. zg-Y625]